LPFHCTCLTRSVAIVRLLRAGSIPAVVRIGVGFEQREMRAHAWVEVCGHAIGEGARTVNTYAAMDLARLPSDRPGPPRT
jgi:hypothetical protein